MDSQQKRAWSDPVLEGKANYFLVLSGKGLNSSYHTFTNFSEIAVGSHENTSLVQHPPHLNARVHGGQTVMSGSGCFGNAIVCSRGLHASNNATLGASTISDENDE